jgi:hypothetical protein
MQGSNITGGMNEVYSDKAAGSVNAVKKAKTKTGGDNQLGNDPGIRRRSGRRMSVKDEV